MAFFGATKLDIQASQRAEQAARAASLAAKPPTVAVAPPQPSIPKPVVPAAPVPAPAPIPGTTSAGTPFKSLAVAKAPANSTQTAFYSALPKYYGGSTIAGQTQDQLTAQNMVRNTANQQASTIGNFLTDFNANTVAPVKTTAATAPKSSMAIRNVNTAPATIGDVRYTGNVNSAPGLYEALDFALGDILTEGNPYAQASMDSATRQITDNFTQAVLPQLGSAAQRNGAWGGSRQGIVEGLAAGETAKAVGDTAANLAARNYETSLNTFGQGMSIAEGIRGQDVQQRQIQSQERLAKFQGDLELAVANRQISSEEAQAMMQAQAQKEMERDSLLSQEALANRELTSMEGRSNQQMQLDEILGKGQLLPSVLDAGYKPALMLDAIGADDREYDQQLIDADVARHNFGQNIDAERLNQYAQLLSGGSTNGILSGGSNTVTTKSPGTSNTQKALGGAAAGASIGSMTDIENGGGWGALIGALAGLL